MGQEEKAFDLVDRFWHKLYETQSRIIFTELAEQAKQCALICVDEMIEELTEEISPSVHGFRHNYWKEVKQEINKIR